MERKTCINREIKRNEITIELYSCHNINMKFLAVVTPPSVYHNIYDDPTDKLFTLVVEKKLFSFPMRMEVTGFISLYPIDYELETCGHVILLDENSGGHRSIF